MSRPVWLLVALSLYAAPSFASKKYNITVGYLPCNTGELRYKQGLTISGAISIALQEINNSTELLPDVELLLEWHDTACDTVTMTRILNDMIHRGVVAYFGPEHLCHTGATIAHSWNLPVISYSCADYNHDDQRTRLPNFVQIDPTASQATLSVISLLRYYRWYKFAVAYESTWTMAAMSLERYAKMFNMTANLRPINDSYTCCKYRLPCCTPGYTYRFVRDLKNENRIIVYLGPKSGLIEFMTTMAALQLFANGEYMVIFVNMIVPTSEGELEYLLRMEDRGLGHPCPKTQYFKKRAQSLFVVSLSEPPSDYKQFARQVTRYDTLEPFNFPAVFGTVANKYISIYAAYLYDSVKLYAKALHELIKEDTNTEQLTYTKLLSVATNGTRIVNKIIKNSPYSSILGMPIHLSKYGEAEGHFTMLAYKPVQNYEDYGTCSHDMVPVGHFEQGHYRQLPVLKLDPRLPIDWVGSVRPDDQPSDVSSLKESSLPMYLLVVAALQYILFL